MLDCGATPGRDGGRANRARNLRKDAAGGATSRSPRSRGGSRAATAAARCIRGFAALISGLKAPRDHAIGVTFLALSSGRGLRCVTPGCCPRLVPLRSFRLKGVEDVEVNLGSLLNVKVRRARKQASRKRCSYQYVLFHQVSADPKSLRSSRPMSHGGRRLRSRAVSRSSFDKLHSVLP